MKRTAILLLSLATLLCCKKGDDESEADKLTVEHLTHFDISDAKMLIVRATGSFSYDFHKITSGGTVEAVKPMVDGEEATDSSTIQSIVDLTDNYLYAEIESDGYDDYYYLVDKVTGQAFPLDFEIDIDYLRYTASDINGNVYYIEDYQIIRLNISNPSFVTKEVISFAEDHVNSFAVSAEGNAIYVASYDGEKIMRAVSKDGSFKSLTYTDYSSNPFMGIDGGLHYITQKEDGGDDYIVTVTFNPITTNFGILAEDLSKSIYSSMIVKNKSVLVYKSGSDLYHVNGDNTLRAYIDDKIWNIDKIIDIHSNDNFYFLAFQTSTEDFKLKQVDPSSPMSNNTTLIDGRYEITSFGVLADNTIYFKALDTDVFTSIIGKISPSGEVSTLKAGFSGESTFINMPQ